MLRHATYKRNEKDFATKVVEDDSTGIVTLYIDDKTVVTSETDHVTGVIKYGDIPVANVKAYGLKGDGVTNDQVAMDALLASGIDCIYFPKGVYKGYFNNRRSNRTFIFEEGAIVDGVVHLAIGVGPETDGAPALATVKNVKVIGTVASTVRVGSYYCDGVNVDKIRITEVSSSYANQTTEGGTRGVHLYFGSKNMTIGEIQLDSAAITYGVGIDLHTTIDADHYPENIRIGKITAKNGAAVPLLSTARTKNVTIGEIVLSGGYTGTSHAVQHSYDSNLTVGKATIDGTGISQAGCSGVITLNVSGVRYNELTSHHFSGHGLYVSTGSEGVSVGKLKTYNNTLDGGKSIVPVQIEKAVSYSNTLSGLNIEGAGASGSRLGDVEVYSNGTQGYIANGAADVVADYIYSHDNAGGSGFGVYLSGATRHRCGYLRSETNYNGLRYNNCTDCSFGSIKATGNTTDIVVLGTNSGITVTGDNVFSTVYNSTPLESITGFKGRAVAIGSKSNGDVAATLTVGSSATTQKWTAALTADRAVTLSTTGAKAGDRFRIVRTAAATGAFNLNVGTGPLKALSAAGQWCDVEYDGSAWALVGYGSL